MATCCAARAETSKNANLARALAGLDHELHLFCQDRTIQEPEGVTTAGQSDGDRKPRDYRSNGIGRGSHPCMYREPKPGRKGGGSRRGAHVTLCFRSAEQGASAGHLCSTIGAFSCRYNCVHRLAGFAASAPRPRQRYGPRTRDGSIREPFSKGVLPREAGVMGLSRMPIARIRRVAVAP
jgi:hypothetical protein